MRFIDLFAGLGGFHLALKQLGHICVFASEIDPTLRSLYEVNFGLEASGDIGQIPVEQIPPHEILCAGFPCQPFSKAGAQLGLGDPRGTYFDDHVLRIIRYHRPQFLLLENVPHLVRHNQRQTWAGFSEQLRDAGDYGYDIDQERLSPHHFGIPQIRDRLFVVGTRRPATLWFSGFEWPRPESAHAANSISDILEDCPSNARYLSERAIRCLNVWQDFLNRFPANEQLPSFPIWSMEFGATYQYEQASPYGTPEDELREQRGSHGRPLANLPSSELMQALPSHARTREPQFPKWKINFIRQNREFYRKHQSWLDEWMPQILEFPSSFQKLEWNCKDGERDIWKYILQFRPSGVRVKRPTTAPSLVAMTSTQVPIIAAQKRYLTPKECARLQSMDGLELPNAQTKAFEALGNAVNVKLVRIIAESLLGTATSDTGSFHVASIVRATG